MDAKILPNLLSGTRIALMPALLMPAIAGSRRWFVVLLVVSLATDALDGFLARRLNAYSDLGRKLDSAADYVTLLTGIAGVALLWPDVIQRELTWVIIGMTAFFTVLVFGFLRFGRPLGYHTWAAKVLVLGLVLSLVPLLTGWTAKPFHLIVALQVVASIEQLLIAIIVPRHQGEVQTIWHAWKIRRDFREQRGRCMGPPAPDGARPKQ